MLLGPVGEPAFAGHDGVERPRGGEPQCGREVNRVERRDGRRQQRLGRREDGVVERDEGTNLACARSLTFCWTAPRVHRLLRDCPSRRGRGRDQKGAPMATAPSNGSSIDTATITERETLQV